MELKTIVAVTQDWGIGADGGMLCSLPEGKGDGYVIRQYEEKVRTVQVKSALELADVDYPEDLAALKSYI